MKTIFKYEFEVNDKIDIPTFYNAELLKILATHKNLTFWFLVDTTKPKQIYTVAVYGTGHPCDKDTDLYLDTVRMNNGLVWHLFFDGRKN